MKNAIPLSSSGSHEGVARLIFFDLLEAPARSGLTVVFFPPAEGTGSSLYF